MEESSGYKVILVCALGLAGLAALLSSHNRCRNSFLLFIATLGLGYRTLPVTHDFRIQPAEILILLALLLSPLFQQSVSRPNRDPKLPLCFWILLPFLFLTWIPRTGNGVAWDMQLDECRNLFLVVPIFLVTQQVLTQSSEWRPVIRCFYATGTAVALLGLLEYYVPSVRNALPGFVTNVEGLDTEGGFRRAAFSFYGGAIGVFVCMYSLPLSMVLWRWQPGLLWRLATVAAGLAQLMAVYISGYRSMWLLTGICVFLLTLKSRSFLLTGLLVLGGFVGQEYVSKPAQSRLESLAKILEGNAEDSSGIKRQERIQEAFQNALDNPLGGGFGFSGWVHSDFLQISANLGLIPGFALILGYLYTLFQVGKRMLLRGLPATHAALGFPLFLSFVVAGQMLAVQGVEFHSFTIMPVWLVWALCYVWLEQTAPYATQARSLVAEKRGLLARSGSGARRVRPMASLIPLRAANGVL